MSSRDQTATDELSQGGTDTYNYDAFGNLLNSTGATTPNNYRYRGEQYDPDLGLYYLRARYLNPATGRFMSRDANGGNIGIPGTLHKYLYTGGNPVNRIDPSGVIGGNRGTRYLFPVMVPTWLD
jgi:RHS repeat-associated protein